MKHTAIILLFVVACSDPSSSKPKPTPGSGASSSSSSSSAASSSSNSSSASAGGGGGLEEGGAGGEGGAELGGAGGAGGEGGQVEACPDPPACVPTEAGCNASQLPACVPSCPEGTVAWDCEHGWRCFEFAAPLVAHDCSDACAGLALWVDGFGWSCLQ